MWNYLVCSIFWLSFTWLLFAFGNALVPQKKSQSFKFVTAYLTYSLFVAVGGIIVQLLDLPWIVFAVYMGIVLLSVLLVVLLAKRKRGRLFSCSLKEYIAENWFIYLLCALCCVMLLLYFRLYWYGTHLDDGFYITKVALISGSDSFRDNLTVGMGKGVDISYLINTWEIEASFFVKILRVTPTVFLRLFQSAFNYFLFFNSALAFGGELLISIKKKANLKLLQYVLGVFLLFFIYYVWLMDSGLFFLRDMFHLNCAMFYGSSIAKLMVFICPLLYFLRDEKINLRMVVGVVDRKSVV